MYYTSTDDAGHHAVAYRTSASLTGGWGAQGIAYSDYHVGTAFGPTESPFVVQRGQSYCLFIGPRGYDAPVPYHDNWTHPGYRGTDVFCSPSAPRWVNSNYVGHIYAHAAEVVTDEINGRQYVTSAGIHQNGLYVAPLNWL